MIALSRNSNLDFSLVRKFPQGLIQRNGKRQPWFIRALNYHPLLDLSLVQKYCHGLPTDDGKTQKWNIEGLRLSCPLPQFVLDNSEGIAGQRWPEFTVCKNIAPLSHYM